MSKYMGECWKCDSCGSIDNIKPWGCPICGEETCEWCFDYYGVCNTCCQGKTIEEIRTIIGYVDEDEEL